MRAGSGRHTDCWKIRLILEPRSTLVTSFEQCPPSKVITRPNKYDLCGPSTRARSDRMIATLPRLVAAFDRRHPKLGDPDRAHGACCLISSLFAAAGARRARGLPARQPALLPEPCRRLPGQGPLLLPRRCGGAGPSLRLDEPTTRSARGAPVCPGGRRSCAGIGSGLVDRRRSSGCDQRRPDHPDRWYPAQLGPGALGRAPPRPWRPGALLPGGSARAL